MSPGIEIPSCQFRWALNHGSGTALRCWQWPFGCTTHSALTCRSSRLTLCSISRYIHLESLKRLQLEDYLMVLATVNLPFAVSIEKTIPNLLQCLYTILIVLLNIVSEVQTNLIAPEDLPDLNPENIAERVKGSKIVLGLESCMCCVIWLCKSCILLLYHKLT